MRVPLAWKDKMDIREEIPIKSFSICAFIVDASGNVPKHLILRRKCRQYLASSWQMVSGRIEQGETGAQAALREILEETGITPDRFYSANSVEVFYEHSQNCINMVSVFVAVLDNKQEVRLTEHDEFRWITSDEAAQFLVFANQVESIKAIEEQFIKNEPNAFLRIEG